jgi:predicted DNA-binding protein (UPF0251 family)
VCHLSKYFCVYAHNQLCDSAQKYIKVTEHIENPITMGWRHRCRRGRRGRFPKPITIEKALPINKFSPSPQANPSPVNIETAEIEALRLVDLEGLSQEEAGERMGVSRGTIWRLVQSARKKTVQALTEGRPLQIATEQSSEETQNASS